MILLSTISQYTWFLILLMILMRVYPLGLRLPKTSSNCAFIPNLLSELSYSWNRSTAYWLTIMDRLLRFDDEGDLSLLRLWILCSELVCMSNTYWSFSSKSLATCSSSLLSALSNNLVFYNCCEWGVYYIKDLKDCFIYGWNVSGILP